MGFLRVAQARRRDFAALVARLLREQPRCAMPDLLNALVAAGEPVRVVYGTGNWLDIDSLADLVVAGSF
jgi:phosphoenolpyruvate phosphomutase